MRLTAGLLLRLLLSNQDMSPSLLMPRVARHAIDLSLPNAEDLFDPAPPLIPDEFRWHQTPTIRAICLRSDRGSTRHSDRLTSLQQLDLGSACGVAHLERFF